MKTNSPFLRRKEQEPKGPSMTGWLILFLITLVLLIFKVYPLFDEWNQKRIDLALYEKEIPLLEKQIAQKEAELLEIENTFKDLAGPFLIRESQMYPEYIDSKKISKVLELYALQMSLVENTPFELVKLSIGGTSKVQDKEYYKTSVDVSFTATQKMLEEFIHYLQTGEFTKKFEAARSTGQLDPRAYTFLKENLLPIAQIQSIKIADENVDGISGQISVNIQFTFFSRKDPQDNQ